jgi:hypothetical protein
MLPLFVWGALKAEEQLAAERVAQGKDPKFPRSPGVFALVTPYEGMCCEIDVRCPAQFVNDAIGIPNATPNIIIVQHPKPVELLDITQGLQMFLQAKALRDIKAGDQLFLDYGEKFWEDDGVPIGSVEINAEQLDKGQFSDDEDDNEKKEREEENVDLDMTSAGATSGGLDASSFSSSSKSPGSANKRKKPNKGDTPKNDSALTQDQKTTEVVEVEDSEDEALDNKKTKKNKKAQDKKVAKEKKKEKEPKEQKEKKTRKRKGKEREKSPDPYPAFSNTTNQSGEDTNEDDNFLKQSELKYSSVTFLFTSYCILRVFMHKKHKLC